MKLVVKNLYKNFGKKQVLNDISFEFEQGKIYGLLGRNGAGKTTFISSLTVFYFYTLCYDTNYLIAFLLINMFFITYMISISTSFLYIYYTIQPYKCVQICNKIILKSHSLFKLGIIVGINLIIVFLLPTYISNNNTLQYMFLGSILYLALFAFYVLGIKTKALKKSKIKL